jgi:hypothetical protein
MALSLIVIGLLLLVSAVQDTQDVLFATVESDFTGPDNFVQWIAALALVGALGYLPKMRGFSVALLALVLLAIFLRNGTGFFAQLQKTISASGITAQPQASSYSAA